MRYEEFNLNESYPKHQDLSGVSTDKLKAYLAKQSQQAVPGEGSQVKRVQAELQRREQGVAEGVTPASVSKVLRLVQRHKSEWFDNYGMGEVEDTVVDMAEMGQFQGMSAEDALALVGQELESLYGQQGMAEGKAAYGPVTDAHKAASKKVFAAGMRDGKAGAEKNKQHMASALMKTTYLNGYKQGKQGVAEGYDDEERPIRDDGNEGRPGKQRYPGKLKEQGVAEGGYPEVDHMPGPTIKRTQTGCKRCHGKGYVYKTDDGEVHPMNRPDAKKYKCGKCNGIGFVKVTEQDVAEGSEQVYNILALDKGNALKKPTKLKWKASSLEDIFDALAAQDWYPLEINGVEVIAGKRLKQGVAEGSLNEFAPDGFNGGDDGDGFDPEIAKMAQEDGFTKGVGLADGATLERAMTINHWHSQHGGMYKQYFAKGFKQGRMNKVKHDNRQYNLNLKLMKDGSIRHGEQGVEEGMLDNPGEQDSPVAQAIIRRILLQRTDLLAKHGPEKVGQAVDEVADFVGDVDEIGSSDVSGWVRHVEQMLGNMQEGVAEAQWKNMDSYERDYAHSVAGMSGRRNREDDEHHEIDRQREQQLAQYNQSGKFWLKFKDSGRHVSSQSYTGKAAANAAALALLKQQPELKGNLLITAYGPGGE